MTTEVQDLKTRLVAVEQEFMTTVIGLVNPVVVPVGFYAGVPPYCTNRIAQVNITMDGQEEMIRTYQFIIEFTTGYYTENYDQMAEMDLDIYAPQFLDYIESHRLLQSHAFPAAMDNMDPRGVIINIGRFFQDNRNGGTGDLVYNVAFLLEAPIKVYVEQRW